MRYRALAALLVAAVVSIGARGASAQTCIPYMPDPREEPWEAQVPSEWTAADGLLIWSMHLTLEPSGTTYRMRVLPWTHINGPGGFGPGFPDRDYHLQPSAIATGGAVLVSNTSDSSDRIFTAAHVLHYPPNPSGAQLCNSGLGLAVVFGYGNFSPDQWQLTCDPFDPEYCWVTVDKDDVYFCVEQWDGFMNSPYPDWGVGRLDRKVKGRTPRRVRTDPTLPNTALTIVGHPNSIPMKVEEVQLVSPGPVTFATTGHVLQQSSGSMVVDPATDEVVGAVRTGYHPIGFGCADTDPLVWKREDFAAPSSVTATAAYLAAAYVP
jgi:hypothetical protein